MNQDDPDFDVELDDESQFWDWAVRKQRRSDVSTNTVIDDSNNSSIYVPLYVEIIPPLEKAPEVEETPYNDQVDHTIWQF